MTAQRLSSDIPADTSLLSVSQVDSSLTVLLNLAVFNPVVGLTIRKTVVFELLRLSLLLLTGLLSLAARPWFYEIDFCLRWYLSCLPISQTVVLLDPQINDEIFKFHLLALMLEIILKVSPGEENFSIMATT